MDKLQYNGSYAPEITHDTIFSKDALDAYNQALRKATAYNSTRNLLNKKLKELNLDTGNYLIYFTLLDSAKKSATYQLDILQVDSLNKEMSEIYPQNISSKFLF